MSKIYDYIKDDIKKDGYKAERNFLYKSIKRTFGSKQKYGGTGV